MQPKLRVLSIGLDDTLLVDEVVARGDAAARQRRYAERLGRLDIVVFTRRASGLARRELAGNVAVYPTDSRHSLLYVPDALRVSKQVQTERGRADLVITQDPFLTGLVGYLIARRWGIGLSVQLFSSFFDNPQWLSERPINRLLSVLGKWVVRAADTVRVESPIEKQHLTILGVPAVRVWVIPILYNLQRFAQADGTAIRAHYLDGPYTEMVLFVGRLAPEKDIPTLLHAVPRLADLRPGARIVIVGRGHEGNALRQMAAELELGDRVVFVGGVSGEELPAYFHACDVFVLPSIYEGIPTVLVEAAASGKPVVSTRTRNVDDVVVDGQTGLIVPVRDAAELASALARVLSDPAWARQMGQAGRELVHTRFSQESVLSNLTAMWTKTAVRKRSVSQPGGPG
ncbi:MAG TPA: glycosyltransferase family 4 protein [Anaerolineae bacterium]|nr:glycosyltransferase family 4 protein [Anaerolineae bacterium]